MIDIITDKKKYPRDPDMEKDCPDFVPLDDGTIKGDWKYCNLSFQCRQIGMLSDYVEFTDENGNVIARDYLCTGKRPIWEERSEDEKAS